METALGLYANKRGWKQAVNNAMQMDYSWSEQGAQYVKHFRKLLGQ
jgi:glycogen synthase